MKTTNSELQRYNLIGTFMKNWYECADDSGKFYVADEADAVIEGLRDENAALKGRIARLEGAIASVIIGEEESQSLKEILNESTEQSTNVIVADGIEKMLGTITAFDEQQAHFKDGVLNYLDQLRGE